MPNYAIEYFRVSLVLSGIFGYFRCFRVNRVFTGILDMISFFWGVMSKILRFDGSSGDLEGIHIRGI